MLNTQFTPTVIQTETLSHLLQYSLLNNPEFCTHWMRVLLLIHMESYLRVSSAVLEQISNCLGGPGMTASICYG